MVSSSITDLEAEIVEVEKLFHTLEGLILQQSIGRVGNFEKLLSEHQIELSKKDYVARNAGLNNCYKRGSGR